MTTTIPPNWTFPVSSEDFETEAADNATTLFNNILLTLHRLQQQTEEVNDRCDQIRDRLETSEEHVDRLRGQRNQLQTLLQERTNTSGNPETIRPPTPRQQPPPPPNYIKSEKIPDPPMYSGSRTTLSSFTLKLRTKLRTNADRFPSDVSQVDYAVSRLEGQALDLIMASQNEETEELDIASVSVLIQMLKTAFGDPDPTNTARRELQQLQQTKQDFATYHAQFTRIVGKLKFNDEAKRVALEAGMSSELKDTMTTVLEPTPDYAAYVRVLLTVDNRLRARKEEKAGRRMGSFVAPPVATPHPSHTPDGLAPMDLSALRNLGTPRPPQDQHYVQVNGQRKLSPAEKKWRMDNGRCAFCAGEGHVFASCPQSHNRRPTYTMRGAATNTTAAVRMGSPEPPVLPPRPESQDF